MAEKRLKIAFLNITQNLVNRGAETFVKEVSERLKKKGHIVKVISGRKLPGQRWPIVWRFFVDPHGLSIALFTLKNCPYLLREKFDIVIPVNGGWQPALIRLVSWLYGGKVVISGHSGIGWDDRNNLWSFPNAFVALSDFAKKWAKRVNPFVKIEQIPNGVDLQKFKPEGEKLNTRLQKPIVLCVAALTPTKRIELAIKAVAKIKEASLLVVGDGDLREEIENLGEKLLGDRFQLIKVPFEKMPRVYRAADIFTTSSTSYYSFEIVLVEAMATGLPVVANNDPIRREIVGDAGVLVDPTNIKEYSLSLKRALGTDWGDRPSKQAKKFDWDKIAEKYEKLFKRL